VAIATALAALACMLAVQAREAGFVHVRCAEHGELMHVQPAAHAGPTAQSTAGTHVASDRGGAKAGHDHCMVVGANHCMQHAPAPVAATEVATLERVVSVAPAEYLARATFRLAPKTSPPV
jgi:hypothetical protein